MNFTHLIDYLFPKHCISCHIPGEYLCKTCKRKLTPHPEICPYCHRTSKDYATCFDCKTEKGNYLEGIIIPFAYTNETKRLILRLKYYHKRDVIDFLVDRLILAIQMNQTLQKTLKHPESRSTAGQSSIGEAFNPQFLFSFIPSHRYRKRFVKGYNQSELLAKKLTDKLGLPCIQLVEKNKRTKSQAQLTRKQRLTNLQGAFSLKMEESSILNLPSASRGPQSSIFIVDDVATTGSTLNQIAKTIKAKFPKVKVRGIVIARHMR